MFELVRVVEGLNHDDVNLTELSKNSKVSKSTISYIRDGVIVNPGYNTVQKLGSGLVELGILDAPQAVPGESEVTDESMDDKVAS